MKDVIEGDTFINKKPDMFDKQEKHLKVVDLLNSIISKDIILPPTIRVDGHSYQFHLESDSYIRKEKGKYRELTNDLSAKMLPRDWLQLKVDIITDEEYKKILKDRKNKIIGVNFQLDNVPDNILGLLLGNVNLDKYYWALETCGIAASWDPYYFYKNGLAKFIKKCSNEQVYDIVLSGYPRQKSHVLSSTPDNFLNSDCILVLIICDCIYCDIYFKDDLSQTIIDNLKKLNIKYRLKTLENDNRISFSIY